jgi:hypothetical protein
LHHTLTFIRQCSLLVLLLHLQLPNTFILQKVTSRRPPTSTAAAAALASSATNSATSSRVIPWT